MGRRGWQASEARQPAPDQFFFLSVHHIRFDTPRLAILNHITSPLLLTAAFRFWVQHGEWLQDLCTYSKKDQHGASLGLRSLFWHRLGGLLVRETGGNFGERDGWFFVMVGGKSFYFWQLFLFMGRMGRGGNGDCKKGRTEWVRCIGLDGFGKQVGNCM
jgi:hypothetical protein